VVGFEGKGTTMTYREWVREGEAELAATAPMTADEWVALQGAMAAETPEEPEQDDLTPAGKPKAQISQATDGNIFVVGGTAGRGLRRTGHTPEEVERFYRAIQATGSYAEALRTVMDWADFV
jgi:hypothetical protein